MTQSEVMILNLIKLKQKMIEMHISNKQLMFELGISRSSVQRKLSGTAEFTQGELKIIVNVLKLSSDEVMSIFFN